MKQISDKQRSKPSFQFMNVTQPIQFDEDTMDTYRQQVGAPQSMNTDRTARQEFLFCSSQTKAQAEKQITSIEQLYQAFGGNSDTICIGGKEYTIKAKDQNEFSQNNLNQSQTNLLLSPFQLPKLILSEFVLYNLRLAKLQCVCFVQEEVNSRKTDRTISPRQSQSLNAGITTANQAINTFNDVIRANEHKQPVQDELDDFYAQLAKELAQSLQVDSASGQQHNLATVNHSHGRHNIKTGDLNTPSWDKVQQTKGFDVDFFYSSPSNKNALNRLQSSQLTKEPQIRVQIEEGLNQTDELEDYYAQLERSLALELETLPAATKTNERQALQEDEHIKTEHLRQEAKSAQPVHNEEEKSSFNSYKFLRLQTSQMAQQDSKKCLNEIGTNMLQQSVMFKMESQQSKGQDVERYQVNDILTDQESSLLQTSSAHKESSDLNGEKYTEDLNKSNLGQDTFPQINVNSTFHQKTHQPILENFEIVASDADKPADVGNYQNTNPKLPCQGSELKVTRNKSQKIKKQQSEEDFLYECLINKLKKQESESADINSSDILTKSSGIQQKITGSIQEVEEYEDSFSEDEDSSAGERTVSSIAKHLRKKFLRQVTQKVRQIAREIGIDPASVRLTTGQHDIQPKSQHSLRVMIPEQEENNPNVTVAFKSQKLELALIKSVLRKLNEETQINKNDLVRVNKKIDGSRKLLPIIVEELVGQVSKFKLQFDKFENMKKLHFAFLFACPLVMSYEMHDASQTKYKMIPMLDHEKEFETIQNKLTRSGLKVNVKRRQCTIENLKSILQDRPQGIHFSGHGIPNTPEQVGDYHYQHKDEGDFLLMETTEGDSSLVSQQQLQKLLKFTGAGASLNFVFIATCHSEIIGNIFIGAGAKHVICIGANDEVMDDAVLVFTEAFYGTILKQNISVEQAFLDAQMVVNISFGESEAKIFKLLQSERIKTLSVDTGYFGPFEEGKWANHDISLMASNLPEKVNTLVGRQRDMFQIIQKVLSEKVSRLITVIGMAGVGKTALVKNTIHHIYQRKILQGGYIYLDAQNVRDSEVFIKQFVSQAEREKTQMPQFSNLPVSKHVQGSEIDKLKMVLSMISKLKGRVLIVLENAEDLIQNDKTNFRNIARLILSSCPNVKLLISSRVRLTSLPEYPEELIVLNQLSPVASFQLFQHMTSRNISQREINCLLAIKPDLKKYPDQANVKQPTKLHEHHFFTLLGGNPQAIILVAPLLADLDKQFTLSSLYQLVASNSIHSMLKSENIEEKMLASLRVCLQISIQLLVETDPTCMKLFFLLAMMPGGATETELDHCWLSLEEETSWRSVVFQLEKSALIESKVCQSTQEKKLQLPVFIGSFAEAMIKEEDKRSYHLLIVSTMHSSMIEFYKTIQNTLLPDHKQISDEVKRKLISCELNLWSVISRMHEMYSQDADEDFSQTQFETTQKESTLGLQQTRQIQNSGRRQSVDLDPKAFVRFGQRSQSDVKQAVTELKVNLLESDKEWVNLTQEADFASEQVMECTNKMNGSKICTRVKFQQAVAKVTAQRLRKLRNGVRIKLNNSKSLDENEPENEDQVRIKIDDIDDQNSELHLSDPTPGIMRKDSIRFLKNITQRSPAIRRATRKEELSFVRQKTKIEAQIASLVNCIDQMQLEEQVICYYIYSLILLNQCVIVLRVIKKFLQKFSGCSGVFLGNIMRAKAICTLTLLQTEAQYLVTKQKSKQAQEVFINYEPVERALLKANEHFKGKGFDSECNWGIGITQFQMGLVKELQEKNSDAEHHFVQAVENFGKINHFRGVALCSKHLCSLETMKSVPNSKLVKAFQRDHAEYTIMWRTSHSELQEYLSINRAWGEDFSLQTEIVLLKSCESLYKKASNLIFRLSKIINSKLIDQPISEESFTEDSESISSESEDLSPVNPKQKDQRSKQNVSATEMTEGQSKIHQTLRQILLVAKEKQSIQMQKTSSTASILDWNKINTEVKELVNESVESSRSQLTSQRESSFKLQVGVCDKSQQDPACQEQE